MLFVYQCLIIVIQDIHALIKMIEVYLYWKKKIKIFAEQIYQEIDLKPTDA